MPLLEDILIRLLTTAYFDESPDTIYHIIDRSMFERRLNAHFTGDAGQQNDCPAWYALRNIIYAYGCRIEISKTSHRQKIAESQTKAWAYFENALSVHTELIYTRTDMSAVQALTAMVRSSIVRWILCLLV